MRAKLLAGFAAIAVAAPLCAQADNVMAFNKADLKPDLWYSGPARADAFKLPDIVRMGAARAAMGAQSDSTVANIRETRTIQAVDTEMRRVDTTKTTTLASPRNTVPRDLIVSPRGTTSAAATHAATAAPEMSSGLAATGLTLLLGGISVLRSRRTRSSA
jgi:hypothetical protein